MQPIKQFISRALYGPEPVQDYEIGVLDRFDKKVTFFRASAILRFEGEFMVIKQKNELSEIPLHRVREVRRRGETVWRR